MQTIDHEEFARCLFEESNDAFLIFRPEDNTLVDANPTALRLTGLSHAEILHRQLPDLFSVEEAADIDRMLSAFLTTGVFQSSDELALCRQDQPPLAVQVTASRIHTKSQPLGLVVVRDISRRKNAEAELKNLNEQLEQRVAERTVELQQSETRFRTLAEAVPVSIGVAQDGRRVFGNQRSVELTGYSIDELIGRQTGTLTHPDFRDRMLQQLSDCLEKGESSRQESKIVRKDGQERWVDFSTARVEWNGRPAVIGASIDITQLKEAERRLRLTQFSVDQAKTAVFWCRPNGSFFYVNDIACQWLGYTREELATMHVADINPEFPREAWPDHWAEIKRDGVVYIESMHCRKNGEVYPVEIWSNYVEFEGEEYKLAFVNDITEIRKTEASLRGKRRALSAVCRTKPRRNCPL